jgi:acyl carrier protein
VETLTPESSFEELGIDSLDRINLLFDLENEFDLSIDDEQAKSIANIPQMVAGIEEMLRAKEAGAV